MVWPALRSRSSARLRRARRRARTRGRRSPVRSAALALAVALVLGPALPVLALRWIPPLTSAFMLQRHFGASECAAIDYRWQAADGLPSHLAWAVVAAEDQRFFLHSGFDFMAIRQALDRRGERLRGASTLSQQLAKNLFLWPGRSLVRKGLEAYLTVWIEVLLPKSRILELYLNVAQFGPCTFGAQAASAHYFARPASQLIPRQSALLAAVLPNPSRRTPVSETEFMRKRAARILLEMTRVRAAAPRLEWPSQDGRR
jgi:monofunctional biosynthetic peptidoglycan transglycosylase